LNFSARLANVGYLINIIAVIYNFDHLSFAGSYLIFNFLIEFSN